MRIAAKHSVWGIAIVALSACGGGGSDSAAPPSLVEITSNNAQAIAGAVLLSSFEGSDLGTFAIFAPASGTETSTKTTALYAKVGSLQKAETRSLMKQSQQGFMQAPVGPVTADCDVAGTVTTSGTLASSTTLSAGDQITLSFSDCDDGTTVVNGVFSMRIASLTGDLVSGMFTLGIDVTLTDFQVLEAGETVTANGGVSFTTDTTSSPTITTTITTDSLTVTGGGASNTLLDYLMTQVVSDVTSEYSLEASGTLTSSAFSGSVSFETQVALQGTGTDFAVSGELLITGANGATIHVIVLDGVSVRLEVDLDGDAETDEIVDATWADLTKTPKKGGHSSFSHFWEKEECPPFFPKPQWARAGAGLASRRRAATVRAIWSTFSATKNRFQPTTVMRGSGRR